MTPSTLSTRACYFQVGEHVFAINETYVTQIVDVISLTPVARTIQELLGVFALQGTIIPLFNLPALLGLESPEKHNDIAILIEHEEQQVSFPIDNVLGFYSYNQKSLDKDAPLVLRENTLGKDTYQDKSVFIIDTEKVTQTIQQTLRVV